MIAARRPVDLAAGAAHHEALLDRGAVLQRGIDIGLQRHLLAAAQALVRGDDDVGIAILDAAGQAVGREAAEHHRMDRADARAGQHGVGRFGDHRHVDGDAVAALDAERLQHIRHAADLLVRLAVGDVLALGGIVAFPDDRRLVAALGEMAVEAVGRDVERAVIVPADADVAGVVDVLHLAEGLDPVDALADLAPEAFGVGDGAAIHLLVFPGVDQRALRGVGRDGKQLWL